MTGDPGRRPPLWERVRPGEVLGLSAVLSLFVGVGVLISTRTLLLAVEFFGAAFVVSIVVCATLLLAISKPETGDPGSDDDGPPAH
jgi:hypothetical protein